MSLREFVWVGGCVTAPATTQECIQIGGNGPSVPLWGICVHCCDSRGSSERPWGRRSVHRSAKMTSWRRFGALVYTVATRVAIRIATRAVPGGTSASAATACRRRPLAGPSRLVGKTGSERAAPLPGWHLRRGVNPHEPPKSLLLSTVPKTSDAESFEVGGTWETWPTITLVAEAGSAVSVGDGSSSVAVEGTFAAGRCGGHRHGATSSDRERGRCHGAGLARI